MPSITASYASNSGRSTGPRVARLPLDAPGIQRLFSSSEPSASPATPALVDKFDGKRRSVPKSAGLWSEARAAPARSTAHTPAYGEAGSRSQWSASHSRPPFPEARGFAATIVINPIHTVPPNLVSNCSQPMTTPHPAPGPRAPVRRNVPRDPGAVGGCVRRQVLTIACISPGRALGSGPQKFSTAAWFDYIRLFPGVSNALRLRLSGK
jgi:hypothetical protein